MLFAVPSLCCHTANTCLLSGITTRGVAAGRLLNSSRAGVVHTAFSIRFPNGSWNTVKNRSLPTRQETIVSPRLLISAEMSDNPVPVYKRSGPVLPQRFAQTLPSVVIHAITWFPAESE